MKRSIFGSNTPPLMARLERIEREQRFYRLAVAVIVVASAAFLLMGQSKQPRPSKTIESEKFVLKDSKGRIRGGLATDGDGVVRLALADEKGATHTTLSVGRDGRTGLFLADDKGSIRAGLAILADGTPDFGLADSTGNVRVGLGFEKTTDSPALVFYDSGKVPIVRLP